MATVSRRFGRGGKRGQVTGWSPAAARRNVSFLRSVDERTLSGVGLALTLTLRDCPPSREAWSALLKAWQQRQYRGGMLRLHWCVEWQRRGVPHLHAAIWYQREQVRTGAVLVDVSPAMVHQDMQGATFESKGAASWAIADWLDLSCVYGSQAAGQQARPLVGPVGWFIYLGKHCGRGRAHYQRQQQNLPTAWSASPRVWGRWGSWVCEDPQVETLTDRQWWRMRRLVRGARVARARRVVRKGWGPMRVFGWADVSGPRVELRRSCWGDVGPPMGLRLRSLVQARRMLRCGDRKVSAAKGVSEWMDEAMQASIQRALQGKSMKGVCHDGSTVS